MSDALRNPKAEESPRASLRRAAAALGKCRRRGSATRRADAAAPRLAAAKRGYRLEVGWGGPCGAGEGGKGSLATRALSPAPDV